MKKLVVLALLSVMFAGSAVAQKKGYGFAYWHKNYNECLPANPI